MTAVAKEKSFVIDAGKHKAGKNLNSTESYKSNPHKAIIEFSKDFLDNIVLAPSKVLVATYIRPEIKTSGGIITVGDWNNEDKFQGVAALVLKLGSRAFKDDDSISFAGFSAKQYDWVMFRPSVGVAREFNGLHCRIVEDKMIDGVISDPTLVW